MWSVGKRTCDFLRRPHLSLRRGQTNFSKSYYSLHTLVHVYETILIQCPLVFTLWACVFLSEQRWQQSSNTVVSTARSVVHVFWCENTYVSTWVKYPGVVCVCPFDLVLCWSGRLHSYDATFASTLLPAYLLAWFSYCTLITFYSATKKIVHFSSFSVYTLMWKTYHLFPLASNRLMTHRDAQK